MYEHEDGNRMRRATAARTLSAPADEGDARAWARRALQDSYDWRDDEPHATTSAGSATPDARSAAARAEARRSRREVVRSISRTVGV